MTHKEDLIKILIWTNYMQHEIDKHRFKCQSWKKNPPEVCIKCMTGSVSGILCPLKKQVSKMILKEGFND